jgi:magnesium-protoporphyrin IX monomethyl ester (oxidative) cyclase
MRAHPELLSGLNKLWVKFFLVAVFATMYVRDHQRPYFHEALGIDPTEYGYKVFKITSEISRQVFPLELDIDNPAFFACLEKLRKINDRNGDWQKKGGLTAKLGAMWSAAAAGTTLLRLYLIPAKTNDLPADVRLAPTW